MDNLERLKKRTGSTDEVLLSDLLVSAKVAILNRRFPFKKLTAADCYEDYPMEEKYYDVQFRAALDLYNKLGAEGELEHIENGIHRTYESSWISAQILSEVVPKYEGLK